jgi:hypothetical protein
MYAAIANDNSVFFVIEKNPHQAGAKSKLATAKSRTLLAWPRSTPGNHSKNCSILEIFEKRLHRNARSLEDPVSADLKGFALHRLALAPLQHG